MTPLGGNCPSDLVNNCSLVLPRVNFMIIEPLGALIVIQPWVLNSIKEFVYSH